MLHRFGLPLLLLWIALPASAQQVPVKGTDATLDVATWNIKQFGSASSSAQQIDNVRDVIEQAGIDLWAIQEITDPDDFDRLLADLGDGYNGVLAASGSLRIGYIYKTDVIRVRAAQHILENLRASNGATLFAGRPPLQIEVDVLLPDTTVVMTFITLHMKCCGDSSSYTRRLEASQRLKNRIDFTLLDREPVVVLGDFNDELGQSISGGRTSPYQNFLADSTDYAFLTLPLDQQNIGTFCNNALCTSGSTLDHILITDELFTAYEAGSADRFDELVSSISNYRSSTSDHLPVFARFRFGTRTDVEAEAVPAAVAVRPAYPNPFRRSSTLAYTLSRPVAVRVEVFDLLGRRVATLVDGFQATGEHRATFDAGDLPPGLYLMRFRAGDVVHVQRVVHLR
ncbi:MAG: endonuclease/exonuclease/phosphatase family protein [Rhodothermales bacterium]